MFIQELKYSLIASIFGTMIYYMHTNVPFRVPEFDGLHLSFL